MPVIQSWVARRWPIAIAGVASVSTVLAMGFAALPGEASVTHSQTAAPHKVTLSAKLGKAVFKGNVNFSQLPKATPKTARQHAVPLPAVNRPLKSATQLATYRHFVLNNPGKLPKGTASPAPSKVTPSFLSSNRQIPKLVRSGAGINFTQSGCGCTPPDQAIATNGTQVFEGVNNLLKGYSTSLGTAYGPFTAQAFFAPVFHSGDFFSDPQITYNATTKRWLVAWLEIQPAGGSAPDYIDLAVSSSSSISSTYHEYQILSTVSGSTDFCDYPTMGYEHNAEWLSCTTFDTSTGNFLGNRVFGFPFKQMDAGTSMPFVWFYNIPTDLGSGAYRLSPATEDGTPQAEFITASDAGFGVTSTTQTLCAITNTAAVPAGTIPTGTCDFNAMPLAYDDPIFADQPGNPGSVYPGVGTKQIAYRDGRLWVAMPMAINCGTTEDGIWWADFIPQLTAISSGYPQSVNGIANPENAYWCYSQDTDSYLPSIEPDSEGGAALTLSLSNDTNIFPSLAYTGRSASDPVNSMGGVGASAYYAVGSSTNTTGRYGDYSACSLIPGSATRGTEWCAGEFGGSDVWNTQIADLQSQ
jgi:hypothetical protein